MVISAAMTLDTEGGSCMKEQKRDLEREGQILLPSHILTPGQLLYKLAELLDCQLRKDTNMCLMPAGQGCEGRAFKAPGQG